MKDSLLTGTRIRPAPENHLGEEVIQEARRRFMGGALIAGAAAVAAPAVAASSEALEIPEWTRQLGPGVGTYPYGMPSRHEANVQRRESPGLTRTKQSSVSFTPLQSLFGIVTPSGLHFERYHAGLPDIDPTQHRLAIHGLVEQPRIYSMDDLLRLPSESRFHFVECGANTAMEWGNSAVPTVQYTHGMLSCSEYTGVPLKLLLEESGYDRKNGKYLLAEGADGAALTRTVGIDSALDDAMVVYAQNGEMLRPEQGYPLRLLVPGVQGISQVKWLRRLEVGDMPWNTREESLQYADFMPDGRYRQYTWIQEAKSVITTPSGGQVIMEKGYHQVTGLAWSGRGRIKRVDVSVDGGRNWREATLQEPVMSKCLTRFRFDWNWDGGPALLQSRAIDETGYVQPQMNQLREVRGTRSIYHNNAIQTWKVAEDGVVTNVQVS